MTIGIDLLDGDESLAGWWKLDGDARDSSGRDNHGASRGIAFERTAESDGMAARFDGKISLIEVPHSPSLALGRDDFTLAAWVRTDRVLDDSIGDLLSKYDPAARRGFMLGAISSPGSVYSTPNARDLQFGIDAGRIEQEWTDCGRPGTTVHVFALCAFGGNLYAGTFEPGASDAGGVWRYAGGTEWEFCGSPDRSNTVMSLAVMEGALYAGTGRYRASGSALADSANETPGGRVFRYRGGRMWEDCGRIGPDANEAHSLTVFRGQLYAVPAYSKGVFRYLGGRAWEPVGAPGDRRIMALGVWNGHLYSGGNEFAGIWRYEGGTYWSDCGQPVGIVSTDYRCESQIYSFATYEGRMHVGTWPSGMVFRYDGGRAWTGCGRLGEEREVMGTAVYNGQLYAGTLPLAQVWRYVGDTRWTCTGRVDHTPDVTYRRAWSMAVWRGKLFCGTLPSGRVWSYEAGKSASAGRELAPGWRHVAAVRAGNRLQLYVDGREIAESTPFAADAYDLTTSAPLSIGFGPYDHLNGYLRDVRVYRRALDEREIVPLARGGGQ